MTDDIKTSDEWKIQLTMKMKFMSTKVDGLIHFKSDNR